MVTFLRGHEPSPDSEAAKSVSQPGCAVLNLPAPSMLSEEMSMVSWPLKHASGSKQNAWYCGLSKISDKGRFGIGKKCIFSFCKSRTRIHVRLHVIDDVSSYLGGCLSLQYPQTVKHPSNVCDQESKGLVQVSCEEVTKEGCC